MTDMHLMRMNERGAACGAEVTSDRVDSDIAWVTCSDCDTLHNIFIGAGGVKAPIKLLDMLEELLSITETAISGYGAEDSAYDRDNLEKWRKISATVADIREGTVRDGADV